MLLVKNNYYFISQGLEKAGGLDGQYPGNPG
jgi:hypothetical protein